MYVSNLMEPHVVSEMWVSVKFGIPAVGRPSAFDITAENMNNSMLYFLSHLY